MNKRRSELQARIQELREGDGFQMPDEHWVAVDSYLCAKRLGVRIATYKTGHGTRLVFRPKDSEAGTLFAPTREVAQRWLSLLPMFQVLHICGFGGSYDTLTRWAASVGIAVTVARLGPTSYSACRVA